MKVFPIAFLLATGLSVQARLGESTIQCDDRHGPAKRDQASASFDKMFPILDGAIQRTFDFGGWTIKAAFLELDGPAVCIVYQKNPGVGNAVIQDYEITAILEGEKPAGMTWTPIPYQNPNSPSQGLSKVFADGFINALGARAWRRSDGAVAQMFQPGMQLRIESPAGIAYEQQLKSQKEQAARASVPQF
jgi:hypothetical protein